MIKVLTAEQMREVDRLTTERYGIPSILLMENAAHAVARVITEKLGGSVRGKSILILCGPGNNGGDGAALARILWTLGAKVEALFWGDWRKASGDALSNYQILDKLKGSISLVTVDADEGLLTHWAYLRSNRHLDLIVDAVFGTGLNRPLSDEYVSFLDMARDYTVDVADIPVIAIDLPSGLNSDGDEPRECPLEADVTVTFTAPKPATVMPPMTSQCGEVIVANIGSPGTLLNAVPSDLYLARREDVQGWMWHSRFVDASYKNKRGHLLVIAGSRNYTGAAVLCGDAAIRSGVGLVTIATPEGSLDSIVARVSPEVMVRGISQTEEGSAAEKAIDDVNEFLKNVDAIAVGSGLSSKEDETKSFVRRLVEKRTKPVVIDADGLTALSPWQIRGNDDDPLILTPHEGEFRKLLGVDKAHADELLKDRVAAVRDFATKHHVILLLKGERNLIGGPDGRVVVNPTGNSGLGKAGNGDTLTGILAGFVAQAAAMRIDMFETVVAASYVAGMAGDLAESKFGKRVMTASDVRDCLVEVFAQFERPGDPERAV